MQSMTPSQLYLNDPQHTLGGEILSHTAWMAWAAWTAISFRERCAFEGLCKAWAHTLAWHLPICPPWVAHNPLHVYQRNNRTHPSPV